MKYVPCIALNVKEIFRPKDTWPWSSSVYSSGLLTTKEHHDRITTLIR